MSRGDAFVAFVLDQLGERPPVAARAMFGGHGLWADGVFFAIVYRDEVYFRTDEATREAYEARGMPVFEPRPGQRLRSYRRVPIEILESAEDLRAWAAQARKTAPPAGNGLNRGLR